MNTEEIEQLYASLAKAKDKREHIDIKVKIIWYFAMSGQAQKAYHTAQETVTEARALSYNKGLAGALEQWGFVANTLGQAEFGISKLEEAKSIYEQLKDTQGLASVLGRLGALYWSVGDYDQGLAFSYQSLELAEEGNNTMLLAYSYYLIGGYLFDLQDFDKAKEYYKQSYDYFELLTDRSGQGRALNGIGNTLAEKGQHSDALHYFEQALTINFATENLNNISRDYNDIGRLHLALNNFEEAETFLQKALDIRIGKNFKSAAITTYIELAKLYFKTNQYEKGIAYIQVAIQKSQEINANAKLFKAYEIAAQLYKAKGNFKEALSYLELFIETKNQTLGEGSARKIKMLETQFEAQKSQQEAEIYRLKNVELKMAYDIIAQKNKDITDSINYTRRIQRSILPDEQDFEHTFGETLMLNMPRDIVSGDFYWFADFPNKGYKILILADCTGHGVPGAIMTMMGNDLLNSIVLDNQIHEPAEILSQLDKKVTHTLNQNAQDGMDAAVVRIEKHKMVFAGAKSPLIYINAQKQLQKIKGSVFPIGGSFKKTKTF
ncbi:MAG: tetratricopeptide repeat protein [Bernardetiaceae bacterium]|nr:tetratricopeptide repeat protein [Bernardetiaceae bacterium]